jgi:hypothetical protein
MKASLIIAALCLLSVSSFSQELNKKEQRKLYKEIKKEQEAEEAALKAEFVKIMLHQRRFVLEAEQLRDRGGNMVFVSSMINFVAADSISGVIQVGSNTYVGLNGVGGITLEGRISNYEFTYNEKKGSHFLKYNLQTSSGTYDVRMNISAVGRADATISSSWPGKLTYVGNIVPPASSRVFKGSSF